MITGVEAVVKFPAQTAGNKVRIDAAMLEQTGRLDDYFDMDTDSAYTEYTYATAANVSPSIYFMHKSIRNHLLEQEIPH